VRAAVKSQLAAGIPLCEAAGMPHRPKKIKKSDSKAKGAEDRNAQRAEHRRMDFATRSTLARLQNRSSERK
jgi:hypothetical protein